MKLSIILLSALAAITIADPVAVPQKEPADPCDKCDKKFLACRDVSSISNVTYYLISVY
jgi:hypothetical protein